MAQAGGGEDRQGPTGLSLPRTRALPLDWGRGGCSVARRVPGSSGVRPWGSGHAVAVVTRQRELRRVSSSTRAACTALRRRGRTCGSTRRPRLAMDPSRASTMRPWVSCPVPIGSGLGFGEARQDPSSRGVRRSREVSPNRSISSQSGSTSSGAVAGAPLPSASGFRARVPSGGARAAMTMSSADVHSVAPWRMRSLVPSARGSRGEPGTAKTSRPCSLAKARRDERARTAAGLDHDHAEAQPRHDAVAARELPGARLPAERHLRDQRAAFADAARQTLVFAVG